MQVYTKPVNCTSVHKTSLLVYNERNGHVQNIKECSWTVYYQGYRLCELCAKCVQTVTVQVYTKPVYSISVHKTSFFTSVHKTSLLVNNERNVHGQNIKECTWTEHYQG